MHRPRLVSEAPHRQPECSRLCAGVAVAERNPSSEARSSIRTLSDRYTEEHQAMREVLARIEELEKVTIPNAAEAVVAELRSREADLEATIEDRSVELAEIPPRVIEETRLERRVQIANRFAATCARPSSRPAAYRSLHAARVRLKPDAT